MSDKIDEDDGEPVRKLVGHTGPVYSLSFDPIYGSAQQPSSLLSSSQDGTVRLWSLDTYTNLVAYRGHGRDPVWDVEWGPMGVYFASASRDRTAKLWSSDRVAPLRMYTGHLSDVNVSAGPFPACRDVVADHLVCPLPSKFPVSCHWL